MMSQMFRFCLESVTGTIYKFRRILENTPRGDVEQILQYIFLSFMEYRDIPNCHSVGKGPGTKRER